MKSLDKAAKICGQTRQAFVTSAVLAEVAEVLERDRMKKQRQHPLTYEAPPQRDFSDTQQSSVLIDALKQRRQEHEPAPLPITNQGQVVVNVGSSAAAAPSNDIDRLAAYVAQSGNDFERDGRMRMAVNVLHASAATDEERKVLAARLDEAVAVRLKQPAPTDGTNVGKIARMAFDKLTGLLD